MPSSHDDLLTRPSTRQPSCWSPWPGGWTADSSPAPTSYSPGSAPSPPTTSPWRASCCSGRSRTASHPCSNGHRSRSSTTSARGSPAERGRPASTTRSESQAAARFCRRSARPFRTKPYGRGSTRMANSAVTLLRRADAAQADPPERTWMSLTRLKTATSRFDPVPAPHIRPGQWLVRWASFVRGPPDCGIIEPSPSPAGWRVLVLGNRTRRAAVARSGPSSANLEGRFSRAQDCGHPAPPLCRSQASYPG
jgi:hypothetical protein